MNLTKHFKKYFIGSTVFIIVGLMIVALFGLNLGVDFESGTRLEILLEQNEMNEFGEPIEGSVRVLDDVVDIFTDHGIPPDDYRMLGNDNEIVELLFIGTLSNDAVGEVLVALQHERGHSVEINETTISPDVARELVKKSLYAVIVAVLAVVIYVTIRFEYRFAGAAIIALVHDALFIVTVFALLRVQVDLTFIAAMLTIIGYSINDTIVIFDRIRENLMVTKIKTEADLANVINKSIKQNLARTINTTITVLVVALCLFLFGGEGIRSFAFALFIGLAAGAYSSIFIASHIWFQWKKRDLKSKHLSNNV